MSVTHLTLKRLAALIWYLGPVILFLKGSELAAAAQDMEPDGWSRNFSWLAGVTVGLVKNHFIFTRSNRKNLARIDNLEHPRLWEFFRVRFFISLTLMMLLGRFLSAFSQGNHTFMVTVAVLDISIGTALLLSSVEFWRQGVFSFFAKTETA